MIFTVDTGYAGEQGSVMTGSDGWLGSTGYPTGRALGMNTIASSGGRRGTPCHAWLHWAMMEEAKRVGRSEVREQALPGTLSAFPPERNAS